MGRRRELIALFSEYIGAMTHLMSLVALASCLSAGTPAQDGNASALIGKPVPKIELTLLGGKKTSLDAFKGKAVVIDFWATWCGPCVAASPTLEKLSKKYKKSGLVVIGANLDNPNSAEVTAKYVKKHKYTYTFSVESGGAAKSLGVMEGGMISLPLFIFIDKQGVVRRVETGFTEKDAPKWDAYVKEILR